MDRYPGNAAALVVGWGDRSQLINCRAKSFHHAGKGIGKGYEFVGDAVVVQAAKHEEPAISGIDFARLKATIIPDHLRSDALGLEARSMAPLAK